MALERILPHNAEADSAHFKQRDQWYVMCNSVQVTLPLRSKNWSLDLWRAFQTVFGCCLRKKNKTYASCVGTV